MKLITYDPPKTFKSSSDYMVYVNEEPIFLYDARVLYPPYERVKTVPFGYFDFEGKVFIKVKSPIKIKSVDIRPKSLGIHTSFDEDFLCFELTEPAKISIEINGSIQQALLLFANPLETELPDFEDPNVIYFGPGVHEAGVIHLESGKTLYLAGGAYVHGKIFTKDVDNIKICGRGILSAERFERSEQRCVDLFNIRGLELKDIIILDPPNWTVRITGSEEIHISNIKIIGYRGNSDGIDICGSRNAKIDNCFIRNWDDGLVVKAFDTGDVENIEFSNCVLWNDFARPMEVGYENRADYIRNIRFKNIDVIHSLSGYPIMGIHEGDRAIISDVVFEDIRIEDAPNAQLFDLRIKPAAWNRDDKTGRIHSIKFKNIYLNGKPGIERLPEGSRIEGYSPESTIEDITFENIHMLGKVITNAADCNLNCGAYTKNIKFIPPKTISEKQRVVAVESILEIIKPFSMAENGKYIGTVRITAKNIDTCYNAKGKLWLDITPETGATFLTGNELYFDLKPGQEMSIEHIVELIPGKYFCTTQSDYVGLRRSWKMIELAWQLQNLQEGSREKLTNIMKNISRYGIVAYDGTQAGWISAATVKNNLILYADIFDETMIREKSNFKDEENTAERKFITENPPWHYSCLEIFTAVPVIPKIGDAAFMLPETTMGRTTALVHGEKGEVIASEMRNILEITYSFKNQPKVDKIGHIIIEPSINEPSNVYEMINEEEKVLKDIDIRTEKTDKGYNILAVIPFSFLSIDKNMNEFLMEIAVTTVPPLTQEYRCIPLFHSLKPSECVHMFGRIQI